MTGGALGGVALIARVPGRLLTFADANPPGRSLPLAQYIFGVVLDAVDGAARPDLKLGFPQDCGIRSRNCPSAQAFRKQVGTMEASKCLTFQVC